MDKLRKRWVVEENNYLINHYHELPTREIADYLKRSMSSVHSQTYKLKIKKPHGSQRQCNLSILADKSLQSMYWLGFFYADGNIHKKEKYIRLDMSGMDKEHLINYANYISLDLNKIKCVTTTLISGYISTMCRVVARNSDIQKILNDDYQIYPNKTYTPPNWAHVFTSLTDEQITSLLIGFIDGDGNVSLSKSGKSDNQYTRNKINIEVHSSWLENLTTMKKFLYNKVNKLHRLTLPKIRLKYGLAHTSIACTEVIEYLTTFIKENNLCVLKRKWDKCDQTISIGKKHNNIHQTPNGLSI
jgi:hypothetical protein